MTIQRVTKDTEIKSGQWINRDSIMTDGICSAPRKVLKVSGQRVYFANRHGEDDGGYCAKKSVQFVSDTFGEGELLLKASDSQRAALSEARKMIIAQHRSLIDALIDASQPL